MTPQSKHTDTELLPTDAMVEAGRAAFYSCPAEGLPKTVTFAARISRAYTAMEQARALEAARSPTSPADGDAIHALRLVRPLIIQRGISREDRRNALDAIDAALFTIPTSPREGAFQPTEAELAAIKQIGADQDLSDQAVMRQALRHYQQAHLRLKAGETVSWSGDAQRAADFAGPLALSKPVTEANGMVEEIERLRLASIASYPSHPNESTLVLKSDLRACLPLSQRRKVMPNDATLIEDCNTPGNFRVEAEVEDGGVEVAVFSGPNALDRAIIFAGGDYYDSWSDPQGLAGH